MVPLLTSAVSVPSSIVFSSCLQLPRKMPLLVQEGSMLSESGTSAPAAVNETWWSGPWVGLALAKCTVSEAP